MNSVSVTLKNGHVHNFIEGKDIYNLTAKWDKEFFIVSYYVGGDLRTVVKFAVSEIAISSCTGAA